MDNHTVLVLADPTEPQLAMLEALPASTTIAAGNCREAFDRAAPEATVILSWSKSGQLLEDIWRMSPNVRWVHSRSAGLDGVLFHDLIESPVVLTNGRGIFSPPLAEFVVGAALFFAKDFGRMIRNRDAGVWEPFDIKEIAGQTMGIVGYGDIGRAVASRAKAMGMKVIGARRRPGLSSRDPLLDETLPPEARLDLAARSDYLVVCAPLTSETRGMIGEAELRAMKRTSVLMNVGRGPVVDERALIRALENGWIRGAALDVFDQEPLPAGHPFFRLDNVLLSAHCADHTPDWLERAMQFFLDNFERFRNGTPLLNVVDKKLGY